jgi:phenylacetate-coenzyme A ligase PaaK-like adenylate-forming protein
VVVEPDDACDTTELCHEVRAALRDAFNLNIEVKSAEHGALPRFEMKAKRWVRHD